MGPNDVSRPFFVLFYGVLAYFVVYYQVNYKDVPFFANLYVSMIQLMALTNNQASVLLSYADAVLVIHLHGISHNDYYYHNVYGILWLCVASMVSMGFWISLLHCFIEQRQIKRIIPTFPSGSMDTTTSEHQPNVVMLPPSRFRQKIKM